MGWLESLLRPVEMKGFRFVITQASREEVLGALHEIGVAQFREITEEGVGREEREEEFYEVSSVFGRMKDVQEFFRTIELETSGSIEKESLESVLNTSKSLLEEIEPKHERLASKTEEIQERREELITQKDILSTLSELKVPLNYLQPSEWVELTVGRIDEEKLDEFAESIRNVTPSEVFVKAFGAGGTRIIVLACMREVVSELQPLLYRFNIESLDLPRSEKTPREYLDEVEDKLEDLKKKEEEIEEKIEEVKQQKAQEINTLTECLRIQKERQEALMLFGQTHYTTLIEGWSPKEDIHEVERVIEETTDGAYLIKSYEPSESDVAETPVKLENPKFAESFEYLTEMYDLPRYDSTDPTLITAITFSLFFGFTLSDAGYGLMLLAVFLSGYSRIKGLFSKRLRYVMIGGAIGTIIAGALFGSWFGGMLGEHFSVFRPYWVDPIDNPIPFLKLVLFLGIFQLAIGHGIGGSRKDILRGKWKKVVFDDIGSTLLIIGLFLLIFCVVGMGLREFGIPYSFPKLSIFAAFNPLSGGSMLVQIYRGIFYSGIVLAVMDKLTEEGVPLMQRMGGTINTFYSVVDLISDVISYSRILALGVATSVIALVINKIGFIIFDIMSGLFSGGVIVGVIVLALIFAVGHIFNIFINSMTGFVHTMRLHYAEFFQTFYESGGKEYSPFKLIREYT